MKKKSCLPHSRTASHRPQALMQPPCRTSQVICLRNAELADLHRRPAVQSLRCGLCACCFLFYAPQKHSRGEAEITPRSSIVGCFLRPSTFESHCIVPCAQLAAPRGFFIDQRTVGLLWSTTASINVKMSKYGARPLGASAGCSLLRPVPTITCIHASNQYLLLVLVPPEMPPLQGLCLADTRWSSGASKWGRVSCESDHDEQPCGNSTMATKLYFAL
ncbi:hypothetical protein HDV63DRAFT_6593 [Trichoderma sp. SZMC 28014]